MCVCVCQMVSGNACWCRGLLCTPAGLNSVDNNIETESFMVPGIGDVTANHNNGFPANIGECNGEQGGLVSRLIHVGEDDSREHTTKNDEEFE